jgi:BirA family transcriptional regulator, biotin operon repressor / biotin---[acetyl-CoA-carboxylase] ligase
VKEALTPNRVLPLLRGRFGVPYVYEPACSSTQRLLPADAPEGAVAVCEEQTEGRGRRGRSWQAPTGTAILCSTMLRPPASTRVSELSLVAGVAVAETVERATGRSAQVKWPNDVLLDGRKVAGILAEGGSDGVVLGIGLNVDQAESELPEPSGTRPGSLFAADGARRDRAPLLADLLAALEVAYGRWLERGLAGFAPELARRDALRGRELEIDGLRGVAAGIAAGGELVLETDAGPRLVSSGEAIVAP